MKYKVPIALVSVTAAAFAAATFPPSDPAMIENREVTENPTLGYDYDYALTVPAVRFTDQLVIVLPEAARIDPIILYSDDSGERAFFEPITTNERQLIYKDLKAGSYRFGYTSDSPAAFLSEVFVE